MKTIQERSEDYVTLVRHGYECCAGAYASARREGRTDDLAGLTARLTDGASVLDLGCGAGVPITAALTQRYHVTGIDFSTEQLRLARSNVPAATFLHGDIRSISFPKSCFNAVVAFYVLFHVPRDQQVQLLQRIHKWICPGGYLLATISAAGEAGYTEENFFGVPMYWSNFSQGEYESILTKLGFTIIAGKGLGHGYGPEYTGKDEYHPILLAQKEF